MENKNLLENSDTVQDVQVKAAVEGEVLTEVTSLAKEEEKSGVKVETPSAEELVARASSSLIVNMKRLEGLVKGKNGGTSYKISRKGMNRVLTAILSLPTGGLPVRLQGEEEKLAFALGQRLISDRFILMQHHISEEIRKAREAQANVETETVSEGGSNEQQS